MKKSQKSRWRPHIYIDQRPRPESTSCMAMTRWITVLPPESPLTALLIVLTCSAPQEAKDTNTVKTAATDESISAREFFAHPFRLPRQGRGTDVSIFFIKATLS